MACGAIPESLSHFLFSTPEAIGRAFWQSQQGFPSILKNSITSAPACQENVDFSSRASRPWKPRALPH
jgi:hypothetical protein